MTNSSLVVHLDHACARCPLHRTSRHICIAGRGATTDIRMVIIGEAPGREEDQNGEIFIGPAGRLLDQYLVKAGVDLSQVRWENLVHCFPHKDGLTRPPTKGEITACSPYLWQTLAAILAEQPDNPPILVALGNTALEALAGIKQITKNAGSVRPVVAPPEFPELSRFKVIGVIHPASVLRGQEANASRIISDLTYAWMEATGAAPRYWKDYTWITDHRDFVSYVDEQISLFHAGEIQAVGYDLEATGLDDILYLPNATTGIRSDVVTFNLCTRPGQAVVVPYYHQESPWLEDEIIRKVLRDSLARLLAAIPTYMWGGKFDLLWGWVKLAVDIPKYDFDGLDAHRWLWGARKVHRLDDVMAADLGFNGHGVGLDKGRLFWTPAADLTRYAGGDADGTLQLCTTLIQQMTEFKMIDAFRHMMMRGIRTVAGMEAAGVKVNVAMNRYLMESYPRAMEPLVQAVESSPWGEKTRLYLAERTIPDKKKPGEMKAAPLGFNIGSTATLQRLIFTDMEMPVIEKGDSGPSASREVMDKLDEHCHEQERVWTSREATLDRALTSGQASAQGMDPEQVNAALVRVRAELGVWKHRRQVLKQIVEWRAMKDEWTRYVKSIPERIDPRDFVHPDYNMGGTVTGRFSSWFHGFPRKSHGSSSSKPKWQFISRWTGSGGVVMVADRSQSEMRVLASLSGDEALCAVIRSGVDLHTANAANMFGVPVESVTEEQREIAKRCGFGVVYMIGAGTLSQQLNIPRSEAQKHIDRWNATYPKTLAWMHEQYDFAKRYKCVRTPFGRIRWIDGIEESKWGDDACRQACNAPIQSVSSDITYMALLEAVEEMGLVVDFEDGRELVVVEGRLGCRSKTFGFIHDSIMVDTAPGEWWTVAETLHNKLEGWTNAMYPWLLVPMTSDIKIGPSWGLSCALTFTDSPNCLAVSGDVMNVERLQAEMQAHGGIHIISEEVKTKMKGGVEKKTKHLEFSVCPRSGTTDHHLGKAGELF